MEKRLKELGFEMSEKETPRDGSCMFHALLDHIQSNPSIPAYAESHWELRYKIVCEGYEKYIDKLSWPDDPQSGSKKEWKQHMLNPSVWGDEVVLHLAANLLEVDLHVIHAFPESSCNNGVTVIKPMCVSSPNQSIYLFYFNESDFSPAHYQSVWPSSSLPTPSSLPPPFPSPDVEVTEVISLTSDQLELEITEESIRDIQIVVTDQPSR